MVYYAGRRLLLDTNRIMWLWSSKTWSIEESNSGKLRFRVFLALSLVFVAVAPIALSAIELLSIRTYVLVTFIWVLLSSEVLAPNESTEGWWRRLQLVKIVGWFVLMYIVVERFAAVLL